MQTIGKKRNSEMVYNIKQYIQIMKLAIYEYTECLGKLEKSIIHNTKLQVY